MGGKSYHESKLFGFSGATFSFNQDKYQDSPYDGYLLECTYVADGTEAEFTFQDVSANFHLYAFSNRVASSSTESMLPGLVARVPFQKLEFTKCWFPL